MTVIEEKKMETSTKSIESIFEDAIAQFYMCNLSAASTLFQIVRDASVGHKNSTIGYSAENYLKAIQAKSYSDSMNDGYNESVEVLAQTLLNKRLSMEAIELLNGYILTNPKNPILYYLQAIAYAQLEYKEESSISLFKAIELDSDFLFKFRLESDFDKVRDSEWFTSLMSD